MIEPLVAKQRDSVALATAHLNVWEGSVRSSKSWCSLLRWLMFVRTGPAGNLAMIGKTERTLKRNVIDVLVEWLGPKRCKANWGEGELLLLGRRIYLAGANNEAAVGKVQGLTLAGAYVDEASIMPESMWAMLLTRLSVEGAQLFATTNPDNPNHWLMRDYLSKAKRWVRHDGSVVDGDSDTLDLHRFSFRLADNPSLPPTYIDNLRKQFVGLWRRRYVDGEWVLADGTIYDMFDPTPDEGFVVGDLPEMQRLFVSVDYGTTNPFVALLIGVGVDDRLYVCREWRWDSRAQRRQRTDAEYSADLRAWLAGIAGESDGRFEIEHVIVDPSAASFITQLWRDQWQGVRGADNAVSDGIRATSSLLGGRLRIHASCTGLIAEMTGYVWDEKAAKRGVEQPLKVDDHGPDALRYGVMGTRSWWRHWLTVEIGDSEAA